MLRVATNPALTERERIPTRVFSEPQEVNRAVAAEIAALIRQKQPPASAACSAWRPAPRPSASTTNWCGCTRTTACRFATSSRSTSTSTIPMQPMELQSYHRFMHEHLFDHIDIPPENVHIPDGTMPAEQVHDVLPTLRTSRSSRPAESICSSSASAAPATSASTSRAPAARAARA